MKFIIITLIVVIITVKANVVEKYSTDTGEMKADSEVTFAITKCNNKDTKIPVKMVSRVCPIPKGVHKRSNYAKSIDWRMIEMNAYGYTGKNAKLTPQDERGHMLGSSLGGRAEAWNLVPQSPWLNRNKGSKSILSTWYDAELWTVDTIRKSLKKNVPACADIMITVEYNINVDCRPTKFRFLANVKSATKLIDSMDTSPLPNVDQHMPPGK